ARLGVQEREVSEPHRGKGAWRPASDAPAVVFHDFFDGVVFFGEAHQLQADGVHQGFPTGFDDVFANAHGAPTAAVEAEAPPAAPPSPPPPSRSKRRTL